VRCEVLEFRGGEELARGVEGSRVLGADVEGVLVDLSSRSQYSTMLYCILASAWRTVPSSVSLAGSS
jgi:hypothetical protein